MAVAAGVLDPGSDDAWALRCFPAGFTADVDAALEVFERNVERADLTHQHDVWVLVRNVVLDRWGLIETDERAELCQYIDDALTAAGADL